MVDRQFPATLTATRIKLLRRGLLSWFRRYALPLPWRASRDPYAIWVSEVMLQQTQIRTVIPYYERFLAAFPTVTALAHAPLERVLQLWEGLGYYRRAHQLHAAAQRIMVQHQGRIPNEPDRFAELPGVGRYTLGAVLSQAFDLRLPILDGNVARVLTRYCACQAPIKSPAAQTWLWSVAEKILPNKNVGAFNQALMELGQRICTLKQPSCLLCPISRECAARQLGIQKQIPKASPRVRFTACAIDVAIIGRADKVLVVQRPAKGRWANLWEFPQWDRQQDKVPNQIEITRQFKELTGIQVSDWQPADQLRHVITRFVLTFNVWRGQGVKGRFVSKLYQDHRWLPVSKLSGLPFSRPMRKLAQGLCDGHQ